MAGHTALAVACMHALARSPNICVHGMLLPCIRVTPPPPALHAGFFDGADPYPQLFVMPLNTASTGGRMWVLNAEGGCSAWASQFFGIPLKASVVDIDSDDMQV